jgi:hypothetical protein
VPDAHGLFFGKGRTSFGSTPFPRAAFHNALQQFALVLWARDGLARLPLPPRDIVHQRPPLYQEPQQTVEGCQGTPRREGHVRRSETARRQRG